MSGERNSAGSNPLAQVDALVRRHPSRHDLMAYAEVLAGGKAPISRALAAHIHACPQCAREVRAMAESFRFLATAPRVEPKTDLAARIMMEAKKARNIKPKANRWTAVLGVAQATGYAAALVLIATLTYSVALSDAPQQGNNLVAPMAAAPVLAQPALSSAQLRSQVDTLSAAMAAVPDEKLSPRAREQRRAVDRLRSDLAAAQAALARNPGHSRAEQLVYATLQEQAAELRDLYIHREL